MFTRARLKRWTDALRANPEQQIKGELTSNGVSGFCCLGKLCQVEGVEFVRSPSGNFSAVCGNGAALPLWLGEQLGSTYGEFAPMGMPALHLTEDKGYADSLACANDYGYTWIEIADHLDKYYPCEDEQSPEPPTTPPTVKLEVPS